MSPSEHLAREVRRRRVQGSGPASPFGAVFVVNEGATSMLSESLRPMLGIAAAGMIVFAIAPLQRAAEKVANAAMPGVKPAADMTASERLRVHRDQARLAWADGKLLDEERAMLDGLRKSMGISAEDALQVEREAATSR